jgi:uncharacterized sporulation protein YeaH/YhbH (DUF444 family)
MARIVDRRLDGKNKSAINRKRLMRRYKHQLKKAVSDSVTQRGVTEIESGEKIKIPARDISEPQIGIGQGGQREQVHPGNREFNRGDKIERPKGSDGSGTGGEASDDPAVNEEDFAFEISRDEYLDILFEELALPNLVKTAIVQQASVKPVRAGFSNTGVPSNMNLVRTMRRSKGRHLAMTSNPRKKIATLQAELDDELSRPMQNMIRIQQLMTEIRKLKKRVDLVPFIDECDLKFNQFIKQPKPTSQAVMFCLMDVSGSMTQQVKEIAKRFYVLLYLFLKRSYTKTDIVFIRHHTTAKEVEEEEFFYSQETGGTLVSSALQLCNETIMSRYPVDEWNVYVAQASDGDNFGHDNAACYDLMANHLMAKLQYFAYIEINQSHQQGLWAQYEKVAERFETFAMKHIQSAEDIYPVFHELFRRKETATARR